MSGGSSASAPRPQSAGSDGLTAQELRSGRENWWDVRFTRALLEAIPPKAVELVEVGCGLGHVARKVLPLASRLSYVGVDVDAARLAETRDDLEAGPLADRVRLVVGSGDALPLRNGSADVVLFCMTLQHVATPAEVLTESRRVLRRGGSLVAAEPDNLGQRWFFNGHLKDVTRAFLAVIERCRQVRAPADLSIGPRVPDLARAAGFADVDLRVHSIFATRQETAQACVARWHEMLRLFARASGLPETVPEVVACGETLDRWLAEADPSRLGQCGTTAPVFFTTARADGE